MMKKFVVKYCFCLTRSFFYFDEAHLRSSLSIGQQEFLLYPFVGRLVEPELRSNSQSYIFAHIISYVSE